MWFAPFIQFFTSKMGIALISIATIGFAIWGAVSAARDWFDDFKNDIRENTITEVTGDLREQVNREMGATITQLQENDRRQTEVIARLSNNEASRTRTLDRISEAVQETIIAQGGEQPASAAVRQSMELMAAEWDRLYSDKVSSDEQPTA